MPKYTRDPEASGIYEAEGNNSIEYQDGWRKEKLKEKGRLPTYRFRDGNPYIAPLKVEEVYADPYMRDSNPLMDFLIRQLMQTNPEFLKPGQPESSMGKRDGKASEKMRQTKGPVKAKTATEIANRRDKIMKEIP